MEHQGFPWGFVIALVLFALLIVGIKTTHHRPAEPEYQCVQQEYGCVR